MKSLKVFIICLLFFIDLLSQEEPKQSTAVELPDFIITGKDIVRIKKSDKQTPFFVGALTESFILPKFSPEEIPTKELMVPIREDLKIFNNNEFYKGFISGSLGFYSLPDLNANYSTPIENGIVQAKFSGIYNRPYLENTDNYKVSLGGNLNYWSDINSSFLPGTKFKLNADLSTNGYKFFGSNNPTIKRSINNLYADFDISNEYNPSFLFKILGSNDFISLSGENFKANLLDLSLYSLIRFSFVNIGLYSNFKSSFINNDTSNHPERNYVVLRPTAGFQFTELVKGSFGFTISQTKEDKFIMPYAELALKLSRGLVLFGQFYPSTYFVTPSDLLKINPYLFVNKSSNFLMKKNLQYSIEVKFENRLDFEVIGGFKYFSSDSAYYFYESERGKYSIAFSDVKSITPFVNLNIFPSSFGYFFGALELNASQNDTGQTIPYSPSLKLNAEYGYTFNNILTTAIKLSYIRNFYTDIINSKKIENYIDLGLSLSYKFDNRFDIQVRFENLINNKNYLWNNYQEKPFDIILGVKYKL
ncbi:MAG: hypothetical protein NZM09_10995 [Ignavibacterium sp.]|nr:hypothetical protein [Ignavibacterium sp.]MDW8376204.1 hypothetical protein [Ignavibacteriales bacterium]